MKGLDYLAANGKLQNEDILSIVDFSRPWSEKRLFIADLKNKKLLFHTYVSHGRGSGSDMATEFSNIRKQQEQPRLGETWIVDAPVGPGQGLQR